jgi:hypothetical protein
VNKILDKYGDENLSSVIRTFNKQQRELLLQNLNWGLQGGYGMKHHFRNYKIEPGILGLIKLSEFIAFMRNTTIWDIFVREKLYQKLIQKEPSPWFLVEYYPGELA